MKRSVKILLFIFILGMAYSCCKESNKNFVKAKGIISKQGMTTYQYGTHILTGTNVYYALKSDKIDLDNYLNKEVEVRGNKIEGYPIEGGPEYLEVICVK
jgi:hypothetical protein